MLTSWAASLLTGQDSTVLSQAIHHMQQDWDQAAQNIASSIGIVSVPTPVPDAAAQVAEIALDPLAPVALALAPAINLLPEYDIFGLFI